MSEVPKFAGRLGPAPWSGITLNAEIRGHLKLAADKGCKGCGGNGFHGDPSVVKVVQVCHCVNRRSGP
jgi:hypothetical protein